MSLTDLDKEILAEGEKLRVQIHTDTLNVRKSNLLKEIEAIDGLLAGLVAATPTTPTTPTAPKQEEPKPEAPKAPRKPSAKKSDDQAESGEIVGA